VSTFNTSWAVALFWLVVIIPALVALRPTRAEGPRGEDIRVSVRRRVFSALGLFVGLGLVLNGISWISSWTGSGGSQPSATTKYDSGIYPTESFGLKPGEPYPMTLGHLGFSSSFEVTRAPFYFSFQEQSGATTIVSVTHEDDTYFLQIPVSETTYHQVEGVEPSMTLYFKTGTICHGCGVMGQMQTTRTDTYKPCYSDFVNLLWTCTRGELTSSTEVTDELSPEQLDAGLDYWVDNYLDRAEITLTPEMHDKLIGKIG
jgi:hypothetical protein